MNSSRQSRLARLVLLCGLTLAASLSVAMEYPFQLTWRGGVGGRQPWLRVVWDNPTSQLITVDSLQLTGKYRTVEWINIKDQYRFVAGHEWISKTVEGLPGPKGQLVIPPFKTVTMSLAPFDLRRRFFIPGEDWLFTLFSAGEFSPTLTGLVHGESWVAPMVSSEGHGAIFVNLAGRRDFPSVRRLPDYFAIRGDSLRQARTARANPMTLSQGSQILLCSHPMLSQFETGIEGLSPAYYDAIIAGFPEVNLEPIDFQIESVAGRIPGSVLARGLGARGSGSVHALAALSRVDRKTVQKWKEVGVSIADHPELIQFLGPFESLKTQPGYPPVIWRSKGPRY